MDFERSVRRTGIQGKCFSAAFLYVCLWHQTSFPTDLAFGQHAAHRVNSTVRTSPGAQTQSYGRLRPGTARGLLRTRWVRNGWIARSMVKVTPYPRRLTLPRRPALSRGAPAPETSRWGLPHPRPPLYSMGLRPPDPQRRIRTTSGSSASAPSRRSRARVQWLPRVRKLARPAH